MSEVLLSYLSLDRQRPSNHTLRKNKSPMPELMAPRFQPALRDGPSAPTIQAWFLPIPGLACPGPQSGYRGISYPAPLVDLSHSFSRLTLELDPTSPSRTPHHSHAFPLPCPKPQALPVSGHSLNSNLFLSWIKLPCSWQSHISTPVPSLPLCRSPGLSLTHTSSLVSFS